MKKLFLLTAFLACSYLSSAQKEFIQLKPRLFQTSLRFGLLNSSLNAAYRLGDKTMLSADLGIGVVSVQSNYYNKYNYAYYDYNKYFDNFLNFGNFWTSPYSSLQIRRILSNKSYINYQSSPYANTYFYVGLRLKYNTPNLRTRGGDDPRFMYRETYQTYLLFGRKVELGKRSKGVMDAYIGYGVISNYNLAQFDPKFTLGARFGLNLFNKNEPNSREMEPNPNLHNDLIQDN